VEMTNLLGGFGGASTGGGTTTGVVDAEAWTG